MFKTSLFAALLGLLWTCGCSAEKDRANSYTPGDSEGTDTADSDSVAEEDSGSDTQIVRFEGCDKMDILFIIDNSGSMICEQEMLAKAFPEFISVIENYKNDKTNKVSYRVGVTSTSKAFQFVYGKPGPFNPWQEESNVETTSGDLVEMPGQPHPWFEGPGDPAELASLFTQAALLGSNGSGYEMPLECLRLALEKDKKGGPNEGFLRSGSLFVAVVITDEDDCSQTASKIVFENEKRIQDCTFPEPDPNLVPIEEYKSYLDNRLGGAERWVFVGIAGEKGCSGDAYPTLCTGEMEEYAGAKMAIRLHDFVVGEVSGDPNGFGVFADICKNALAQALDDGLKKMTEACNEFPIL